MHNVYRREEAKTNYDKYFEDKAVVVKPKGIAIQIWGGKDALVEAIDTNQAWEADYDENMICWKEGSQTRRIGSVQSVTTKQHGNISGDQFQAVRSIMDEVGWGRIKDLTKPQQKTVADDQEIPKQMKDDMMQARFLYVPSVYHDQAGLVIRKKHFRDMPDCRQVCASVSFMI